MSASRTSPPGEDRRPLLQWLTGGWRPFVGVLALALLVRLPFLPAYAYLPDGTLDESDWKGCSPPPSTTARSGPTRTRW